MNISRKIRLLLSGLLFTVFAGLPAVHAYAGEGFYTLDKTARPGMLVSLTKNPGVVEPANTKDAASLVGVIGSSPSDLTVQPGQVDVQTDGVVTALLSTLNGDINVGDQISPSAVEGFGAKSTDSGWIVGVAQGSLNAQTAGAIRSVVYDTSGGKHTVYTANVPVIIKIMYSSHAQAASQQSSFIPKVLQDAADSIAGHHASAAAVLLSFLLLLAGFGIAGFITNATIRNGLRGIARQPLSKKTIVRQMARSLWAAGILLLLSIGGALIIIHLL